MSILVLTSDTLIGTPAAGNLEYNGQFYGTDSNASRAQMQRITQGTLQNTTSGTVVDFTGIPAWVKRLTVSLKGVSTNGTSPVRLQLGAGSVQATGYISTAQSGTTGSGAATAGFDLSNFVTATDTRYGVMTFVNISANDWAGTGIFSQGTSVLMQVAGIVALTGTLDRFRLTTVNGTDAFDAGSVNIMYEG